MQTTKTTSPRLNHVAATVDKDGDRFGTVVLRRGGWFHASRKRGTDRDIYLVRKFRDLDRAVAWIEKAA